MVSIHNFFYRIEYASGRTPEVLREAVKYLKKAVCDEIMAQGETPPTSTVTKDDITKNKVQSYKTFRRLFRHLKHC